MVTDGEAERAADFLRENAKQAGRLRGERIYAEEYRKSLKAILMNESDGDTVGARESDAYSHHRYTDHLIGLRAAVQADEENRALREGAVMRIEVWRTQSSNLRGRI